MRGFYFDRMPFQVWLSPRDIRWGRQRPQDPRAIMLNLYRAEKYSPRD
ncbi:hypothetical protein MicloDRAFT_00064660 [Microvirga lotononidis]|uniref:Uncharacterized protein n=1 Tax=Microvirga lotononidis TaxID=864069 RepID=I4YP47_9HYPH|nr:hypothetical protein MicloDRAFT_00064660 [Microvirga lotononidis]